MYVMYGMLDRKLLDMGVNIRDVPCEQVSRPPEACARMGVSRMFPDSASAPELCP